MVNQGEMKHTIRGFSRAYGTNVIGNAIISNTFIIFMSVTKGFSQEQISWIMGIIPLITIPTLLIWGKILDKNKELMKYASLCTLFNMVTCLLMFLVDSYYLFFIVALLRTILIQPLGSVCEEYIINITTKAGIPYGKVRSVGTLGFGLAGVVAPIIIVYLTLEGLFLIALVLLFISVWMYKKLPEVRLEDEMIHSDQIETTQSKEAIETKKEISKTEIIKELIHNNKFLVALFVIMLTYGTLNSCMGYGNQTILLELNCPEAIISALPVIMVSLEAIVLGLAHKLKVSEKPYRAFLIGTVIMCVRWVILATASSYMMVIVSTVLHGIIVGITLPAQNYLIAQVVPEKCRSTAYLLSIAIQASVMPGILNLFLGKYLGTIGVSLFGYTYLVLSIVAIVAIVPMMIREKKRTQYE